VYVTGLDGIKRLRCDRACSPATFENAKGLAAILDRGLFLATDSSLMSLRRQRHVCENSHVGGRRKNDVIAAAAATSIAALQGHAVEVTPDDETSVVVADSPRRLVS
jgi:hypothetical protein